MKPLAVALILLGTVLLEAITVWDRPGHFLRPNLVLLPCVYFALWFPIRQAVFAAIAAGLLKDIYSLDPFGLSALSFATSSLIVAALREEIYREHPLTQIFLAGVVSLIPSGATLAYLGWTSSPAAAASMLGAAVIVAVQTALFAPLIIMPLQAMGPLWGSPKPYRTFPRRI